jgi:hypothetical protein
MKGQKTYVSVSNSNKTCRGTVEMASSSDISKSNFSLNSNESETKTFTKNKNTCTHMFGERHLNSQGEGEHNILCAQKHFHQNLEASE